MFFTSGADEALEILAKQPVDIVITDMRMPKIDGAQLLEIVRRERPAAVRIALSGETSPEAVLRTVGTVHQYLAKPCTPESLRATISRAGFVKGLLESNPALCSLVGRLKALPTIPALYLQVARELQMEEPSLQKIGRIVAQDPGMSAKILQLVNSAFFGLPREIEDPARAVMLLGLEVTHALVLSLEIFSHYQTGRLGGVAWESLWSHSLACARLAQRLAREEWPRAPKLQDRAYIAGLLHDVGKLVLGAFEPGEYRAVMKEAEAESIPLVEAEERHWGAGHPVVGAFLLGLWGLPTDLVQTILRHHGAGESTSEQALDLVLLVNAADALSAECGFPSGNPVSRLDESLLAECRKEDRLETWRHLAVELFEPCPTPFRPPGGKTDHSLEAVES